MARDFHNKRIVLNPWGDPDKNEVQRIFKVKIYNTSQS